MQAIIFLVLVTISGISAEVRLGDSCGDKIGHITLIDNCTTAIIVPPVEERKSDWRDNSSMVCCIKSLIRDPSPIGKSVEACEKFGPGIRRTVSSSGNVQPGDYQHNIALGYKRSSEDNTIVWSGCNGVLIHEYYVLTIPYCAKGNSGMTPVIKVRAGTIDLSGEEDRVRPQDIRVSDIIIHPEYNKSQYVHSIALLRLAEPVDFTSYVQPACLYTKKDFPESLISTGWGLILKDDTKSSNFLLKSDVISINVKRCKQFYNSTKYVYDSEFCGVTDFNICNIGFGSPAFLTNKEDSRVTIVGLMSYGPKCAIATAYIFTKISSHVDWIESIVWP